MSSTLTPFVPQSIEQASDLAEKLARSSLLPDALRGKPADVLVTLITGHELGLSPMQAIRGIHVIKGKAVMSADLTVALVKKHSECEFFRLVESTDAKASYETERKGEGKTAMSFTIEQARQAQLQGDNWRKYPAAMLRARCASALARAVYPDLTMGVYDPDEVGSDVTTPTPTIEKDVTPATKTESVKAAVKASMAAKPRLIDVAPGQTEEEAFEASLAATSTPEVVESEPAAPAATPWEQIKRVGEMLGKSDKEMRAIAKTVTGKTKPAELTQEDVTSIKASLTQKEPGFDG